jgi:hypothetical protein
MLRNPFRIDFGLLASVRALREACEELNSTYAPRYGSKTWRIEADKTDSVVLAYGNPSEPLNVISFKFPKIARIALFGDDGDLVCLYPMSLEQLRRTLTIEDGQVKVAEDGDYDAFWEPLKKILIREMSTEMLREAVHDDHHQR